MHLEVKLAETAPKRPLAITIGAAAATLVVVAGILAGPTVLNCTSSANGFTACFQGKLADAGIMPKPATAVATPAPDAVLPTVDTASAPVAPTATPDAQSATATPAITDPSFGLLRTEPDGSTVIAGSGTPGTDVEVYSNGVLLGKARVEASGDWVFVPGTPLPTGGVELTLGQAGSTDRSAQSFVVVIDPDKKTEPLVVASVPGKASEVLQGLAKSAAPAPTAVAALEAQITSPVAQPPAPASSSASTPAPAVAAPQPVADTQPPAAAPAPDTAMAPPAVAETKTEVAVVDPKPEASAPTASAPVAVIPPSIDAIEIDGNRNFFAGGGTETAPVRLYVDGNFIADSVVADGRWLIETANVLTKPTQLIRIDMLKPGSAEVASRAEVNFVVELPASEAPATEIAQAPVADVAVTTPQLQEPQVAAPPAAQAVETAPVPTLVATQVGDPESLRFASGKAIIRRGDNLWTIARRVYGQGIRYTTIYQANNTQIRNPNQIYPGQVFELPSD